jgi:hypothetical protein
VRSAERRTVWATGAQHLLAQPGWADAQTVLVQLQEMHGLTLCREREVGIMPGRIALSRIFLCLYPEKSRGGPSLAAARHFREWPEGGAALEQGDRFERPLCPEKA